MFKVIQTLSVVHSDQKGIFKERYAVARLVVVRRM